jgi:hypothetical protein
LPNTFISGQAIASNNIDWSETHMAKRVRGLNSADECLRSACMMPRVQRYRCFNKSKSVSGASVYAIA